MAIPNDYIDKITNKDSGESRIISPAADKVRVDNENYEGADLDEVLDEISEAFSEIEHHGLVNGRVPFDEATPIVLASLDGDNTDITPYSEGDYFAVLSSEKIYQVENGAADEVGEIDDKLIYCDKATGNLYRWDYTTNQFVQVGGNSGGGDGTVTGVKAGSTTYTPDSETGVVDISPAIPDTSGLATKTEVTQGLAGKVDKETGYGLSKNDYTDADKAKLSGIAAGAQVNVINGIKANGASETLPVENGIVTLPPAGSTISPATATPSMDGTAAVGSSAKYAREDHVHPHDTTKLSQSDVSVETHGDGTFDINVGEDTYTVNLNHTHPNMAKLIVCEESDLPSTLDPATIYAITDSGETEIEKLIIRGMEFAGGVPDTGMPQVTKPSPARPLNLGNNTGSGVTALVDVKARNLNYNGSTDGLTVSVGQNSGLLLSYGQTSDATSIIIPQLDAETGCQITVKYTGSGALDDGALVFSHDNAVLSSVVVVVVPVPVALTAIKLTGTQWLQTDYYPNPNTEFELDCLFEANANTDIVGAASDNLSPYFLTCEHEGDNRFNFQTGGVEAENYGRHMAYRIACYNNTLSTRVEIDFSDKSPNNYSVFTNRSILYYKKSGSEMSVTFQGVSASPAAPLKGNTMQSKLAIGYSYYFQKMFTRFNLSIYGFKIIENGTVVRNYVPAELNGVPGLHDTITDSFISSQTAADVTPIS